MRRDSLVLILICVTAVAGCVSPGPADAPRLRFQMASDEVATNQARDIFIIFVNEEDEPLTIETDRGCIEVQVWVQAEHEAVFLTGGDPAGCTGDAGPVTIAPNETVMWGPFTFRPDEWRRDDQALFSPGTEYPLVADTRGATVPGSWRNETTIRVTEPVDELTIEVVPEKRLFEAGEQIAITARLENPRDEPYTYTSRDGCDDIHVWVEVGEGDEGRVRLYPEMEGYACTLALTDFTIPPGGSLETVVHWDGSRDGEGGEPFVEQGTYRLFALLDGQEDLPSGSSVVAVDRPEQA